MITLKRDGKTYEITEDDQLVILEMTIANGGDIKQAMSDFHFLKFGEPLLTKQCEKV